jgi:hypothetical protein
MPAMYRLEDRDAARDHVLRMAAEDPRVVAAAVIGSLAFGAGDRWSDLDLTFGVDDATAVDQVVHDWTSRLGDDLDAVVLFDLPSAPTLYRVFLLPGCLQIDLSFTPASRFGAGGPRFRLLYGELHDRPPPEPPDPQELFGWAVAYAREARACIERRRVWQAEHSISALRDHALMLACLRRDLPARFGRGFDDLPSDVLDAFAGSLVGDLSRAALLDALGVAVDGLLRESAQLVPAAEKVAPSVRELLADAD